MEITEVRVSVRDGGNKKLKAYATVTFDDCFVVRNIKVIEGTSGLFVAMPARKMKEFCNKCGKRVDTGCRHCSSCGVALVQASDEERRETSGHQDIAHPINQQFRDYMQKKVLDAYFTERELSGVESSEVSESVEETKTETDTVSIA